MTVAGLKGDQANRYVYGSYTSTLLSLNAFHGQKCCCPSMVFVVKEGRMDCGVFRRYRHHTYIISVSIYNESDKFNAYIQQIEPLCT